MVFADDCVGDAVKQTVERAHASGGGLVLLENLRFHPEEEKNDPEFAKQLASLADVYVDDAFGAAHRAHASVEGITHHLPFAAAGMLMEEELRYLGHVLESPEKPFVAILGGAKVSDKIEVIEKHAAAVDRLIIGGAMAYTFFKARGLPVGKSLVELTSSTRRARSKRMRRPAACSCCCRSITSSPKNSRRAFRPRC